jgi:hypothetical protein
MKVGQIAFLSWDGLNNPRLCRRAVQHEAHGLTTIADGAF